MRHSAPNCCSKFMKLRNGYFSGDTYYVFQCEKCGKYVTINSDGDEVA